MAESVNKFWDQVQQLYEQKVPIPTLERGIVNTITALEDKGLTVVSSQTQRPRWIYRTSLEKLWEVSKQSQGAIIKGGWDAVEAAIVGQLPNIEYEVRPMRLFFVDSPTHELGTPKRRGQLLPHPEKLDESEEQIEEEVVETVSDEQQEPILNSDPIWGPFTQLEDTSQVAISNAVVVIEEEDPIWLKVKALVDSNYRSIVFSGPPGTSKTWYAQQIALKLVNGRHDRVWIIQFHPSYSYEDFVEGRIPTSMQADDPFPVRPKLFLKACIQAAILDGLFVLIIDEISRGDPSRIFGEVLTYIEHRDKWFILPYSERRAFVPNNLIILGTMNPYDKSVSDLDQALQRRFEYVSMAPDLHLLERLLNEVEAPDDLKGATQKFFRELQSKCPNRIGHTYFKGISSWEQMLTLWERKLQRALEDHFYPETERVAEVKQRFDYYFLEKRG